MGYFRTIILKRPIISLILQPKKDVMDKEIIPTGTSSLSLTRLTSMVGEPCVADYGAIIICRGGRATMHIDFRHWTLERGAVITLFPGDVVRLEDATADFLVEQLRYTPAMLREASLQLEQTVYSMLRKDRCRNSTAVVTQIVDSMFGLLRIYFSQPECECTDRLVLLQLKAFFIGFYDWLSRNPQVMPTDEGSRRTNELFNQFMELLETHYRESHDVAFYADLMHITPKYLSTIVQRKTGHTTKTIIDHYVILQLKLSLRTSPKSVKGLAAEYHFSDFSFFCRYFKRHTGTTPMEFRVKESLFTDKKTQR